MVLLARAEAKRLLQAWFYFELGIDCEGVQETQKMIAFWRAEQKIKSCSQNFLFTRVARCVFVYTNTLERGRVSLPLYPPLMEHIAIMARPKLSPDERRDEIILFRCTLAEKAQIEEFASAFGMPISEYIRKRSLKKKMPAHAVERLERAKLSTALLRIGNNLNQVTKYFHTGRPTPALLEGCLSDIRHCLDKLREEEDANL